MAWSLTEFANFAVYAHGNIVTGAAALTDTVDQEFNTNMTGFGVAVVGAGVAGAVLQSTLKTFVSTTSFTLNNNASTTVTAQDYIVSNKVTVNTNGTTTVVLTFASALKVGDAISVCVQYFTGGGQHVNSVVDSGAVNVYSNLFTHAATALGFTQEVWTSIATTAAAANWTLTITMAAAFGDPAPFGYVHHWSPPIGSIASVGPYSVNDDGGVASAAMTSNNATPNLSKSVAMGYFLVGNTGTASEATWTTDSSQYSGTWDPNGGIAEHFTTASTVALAATGTCAPAGNWLASLVTFGANAVNSPFYGSD